MPTGSNLRTLSLVDYVEKVRHMCGRYTDEYIVRYIGIEVADVQRVRRNRIKGTKPFVVRHK